MRTERTRKLHFPSNREMALPNSSVRTSPSLFPPLNRGMPGQMSAQSASCWKPLLLLKGRGQGCLPQEKVPHAADAMQQHLTQVYPGCLHSSCLRAGAEKGQHGSCGKLFGQPSVLHLCRQPLLCFMYCGSQVRETHTLCPGLDRFVPPVSEQSSDLQSFSFNSSRVLLLSPRLLHPLTKIFPRPTTVSHFGNDLQHPNISAQVLAVKCTHKSSHKYCQRDEPPSTRKTDITSMNLQKQAKCHNCQRLAAWEHALYYTVFLSSQLANF